MTLYSGRNISNQQILCIRGLVSKETGAALVGSRNECLAYQQGVNYKIKVNWPP